MDWQKYEPHWRIGLGLLLAVAINQGLLLLVLPKLDVNAYSMDVLMLLEGVRGGLAVMVAVFFGALLARRGFLLPSAMLVTLLWIYIIVLVSMVARAGGAGYMEMAASNFRYNIPGYLLSLLGCWLGVKLAALCLRKTSVAAA